MVSEPWALSTKAMAAPGPHTLTVQDSVDRASGSLAVRVPTEPPAPVFSVTEKVYEAALGTGGSLTFLKRSGGNR